VRGGVTDHRWPRCHSHGCYWLKRWQLPLLLQDWTPEALLSLFLGKVTWSGRGMKEVSSGAGWPLGVGRSRFPSGEVPLLQHANTATKEIPIPIPPAMITPVIFGLLEFGSEGVEPVGRGSEGLRSMELGAEEVGSMKLGSVEFGLVELGPEEVGSELLGSMELESEGLGSMTLGSEGLGSVELWSDGLESWHSLLSTT